MKNSFILYTDVYDSIKDLSLVEKGKLLDAIYTYSITGQQLELSKPIKIVFSFIKREIDRNYKRWEDIRQRNIENGKMGGRPRLDNNPKEPKKPSGLSGNPKNPVTVTVTDTVNVNDNVEEDIKLPQKKINSLALTKGQVISYLKAVPGLTSTELREQASACNTYMGMSSWQIKDPGIFFRKWLQRYMTEKATKQKQADKLAEQDKVLPDLTPEQREANFKKIAEIREGVLKKL